MARSSKWVKNKRTDIVWWLDNSSEVRGEFVFSFDKKTEFNLFRDYPHKLSKAQKKIFDKENPFWKEYFSDRQ